MQIPGLSPDLNWFVWTVVKVVALMTAVLLPVPFVVWAERKVAGHIQFRPGPNRVGPYGLIQPFADVVKLLFKEETLPAKANKVVYFLAPMIALLPAITVMSVVPVGPSFYAADVNVALLVFFAMSSLGVYAITLAGWAGNNKYGLIGGLRSSAQMISYELSMGLAVIGVVLLVGSLSLVDIVEAQAGTFPTPWFAWLPRWHLFSQPVAFVAFLLIMLAETNRVPFDLPEAEAELVAGYHVEYSSMKFAAFFMGEYMNMVAISAICTTLFLGGWHVPWPSPAWAAPVWFFGKVGLLLLGFLWVRWTFPRLRYDQLMNLGWKVLLPVTLLSAMLTALGVAWREGWFR